MKYFIISDVHGSKHYLELAIKRFKESKADVLVCLGDFYYHGPRNPLTLEYDPMSVASVFNDLGDKLIAIKGNCDAEVDQMISTFTFRKNYTIDLGGNKFYFHHGHNEVENPSQYKVIFYGHFHVGEIKRVDDVIYANPGSISLPKAKDSQGYMILTKKGIEHYDLITNNLINDYVF